jgi:hypothetical protein
MRHRIFVLLAALPLLLGAGGTVARQHNVLVSHYRTEPVVAVDPADPSVVVAGANTDYVRQSNGTFPVPYFASHDGGGTFSVGTLPMPTPYTTGADPSLAIAQDGTVFYSFLAESPTYCSNGPGAIVVVHSIDRGVSFRGPVIIDSNPADDRPTLAVENVPGKPSHLFISWTRSYQDRNEIWFARSVDGGATFSPAAMLYSSASINFGAEPVVGPHGRLAVSWLSSTNVAATAVASAQVLLAASTDDGMHFGPVRGAGHGFTTLPQLTQPGSLRDLTTVSAAADPSGALYVAYAAVRDRHADGSVDADIWLTRSLDNGIAWSVPARVSDVLSGDRFMPAMSVLGDGALGVAFYDRRNGPKELDVYAVHVSFTHGFKATPNVQVNNSPSPISNISDFRAGNSCLPNGRFFGDYIGTAADGTALGVVWTDTQPQQKKETDLWFARVALPSLAPPVVRLRQQPALPHQSLLSRSWNKLTSGPRSAFSWFARHTPMGDLSGFHLFLFCIILLVPVLTVLTAVLSIREAASSPRTAGSPG